MTKKIERPLATTPLDEAIVQLATLVNDIPPTLATEYPGIMKELLFILVRMQDHQATMGTRPRRSKTPTRKMGSRG